MRTLIVTRLARINWLLVAIVALGLGLRVWGINFGLPYTYAPDESWHLSVVLRMLKEGDPDPHWLGYPHLPFYLNALVFLSYFLVGRAMGVFASPADFPYPESLAVGVGKLAMPSEFLLSRGLTALVGTASVVIVYLIGRRLDKSNWVGLMAALLFAVSPANVFNSHLIRHDTFAVLFLLLAFLWIDRAFEDPALANYVWAGIGVGLAFSGKYNAGLIAVTLAVAHLLNFGWRGLWRKEIYVAGAAGLLAFALTNPFSIFDLAGFLRGLTMASSAQSSHAGMEGNTLGWYVSYLWETEGILVVLGVLQALRFLLTRHKRGFVLVSFPLLYFLFISQFAVRNDRTVMLIIPFLDVLAALLLVELYERASHARWLQPRALLASFVLATALIALQPLRSSVEADVALLRTDSRETARVWIEKNLPPGSRIALEPYAPYVDRARFVVEGFEGMVAHPPDWYAQNGFEYLVFSYGAYGRFYENAARYPEFVDRYNMFFDRLPEVIRFNDGGYEIRIHKTNTTMLPTHRVAARWGVYGAWLELVGYDGDTPQHVALYWRALATRREPLKLTLKLLDQTDHEIAQSSSDLFGAARERWPEGIVRVPWKIAVPTDAAPGIYRLELDVDAEGVGRIPVLSLDQQPISDKLFIGPFKIAPPASAQDELRNARRVDAKFGNAIALLGYSITRANGTVSITLYWQSIAKPDRDYTVFLHLLDASANLRAQIDAQPRGGAYPTSIWDVGEIIRDEYALTLPRDLTPGDYKIIIGMYEYPSLARLNAVSADGKLLGDHLILGEVSVR